MRCRYRARMGYETVKEKEKEREDGIDDRRHGFPDAQRKRRRPRFSYSARPPMVKTQARGREGDREESNGGNRPLTSLGWGPVQRRSHT